MRGNGYCLHQYLCWSSEESLFPEGGHSALGWNDLGGNSTLVHGHSTQGVILPSDTGFNIVANLAHTEEFLRKLKSHGRT